jgi:hypothetical protein
VACFFFAAAAVFFGQRRVLWGEQTGRINCSRPGFGGGFVEAAAVRLRRAEPRTTRKKEKKNTTKRTLLPQSAARDVSTKQPIPARAHTRVRTIINPRILFFICIDVESTPTARGSLQNKEWSLERTAVRQKASSRFARPAPTPPLLQNTDAPLSHTSPVRKRPETTPSRRHMPTPSLWSEYRYNHGEHFENEDELSKEPFFTPSPHEEQPDRWTPRPSSPARRPC